MSRNSFEYYKINKLITVLQSELAQFAELEKNERLQSIHKEISNFPEVSNPEEFSDNLNESFLFASPGVFWGGLHGESLPDHLRPYFKYVISKKLGDGGFSQVYLASDLILDRQIALKILLPEASEEVDIRKQFFLEIHLAAQLEHNNIVRIYEIGIDGRRQFATMEYVNGADLRAAVISVRQFNLAVIRNLFMQICSALQYIHKKNFVHCDIKPENILVGQDGIAKLIDFNLMRPLTDTKPISPNLIGTPAYLPPELIEERPFDQRADIYSLGIMFYEMRTGVPPFEGSASEILHHHLLTTPRLPSKRAAGIHPEEDRIIMKCIAKNPADRYASLSELISDLKSLDTLDYSSSRSVNLNRCSISETSICDKPIETQRNLIPIINSNGLKSNAMFDEVAELTIRSMELTPVRLGRELDNYQDLCKYCQITSSGRTMIANISSLNPIVALQLGLAYGNEKRIMLVRSEASKPSFFDLIFSVNVFSDERELSKAIRSFIKAHDEEISKTADCFFRWQYHCAKRPENRWKKLLFMAINPQDDRESMLMNQAVLPSLAQMGLEPILLTKLHLQQPSKQNYYQDFCAICRGLLTAKVAVIDISRFDEFTAFVLGNLIGRKKKMLMVYRPDAEIDPFLKDLKLLKIAFFKDIIDAVHDHLL